MRPTNLAFVLIAKRAERQNDDVLEKTFVDFGSVSTVLSSIDHQVIFGRRGTGKTHLLTVHRRNQRAIGEIAIQLDMRNLGSAGGIYGDPNIPLPERATRLLIDILSDIHERLLDAATEEGSSVNLGALGPILNEFFDAHREVRVVGTTTVEDAQSAETSSSWSAKLGISGALARLGISAEVQNADSAKSTDSGKVTVSGQATPRLNFGTVGAVFRKLASVLPKGSLSILIDEWSEVPLDLQPYVADLLRRAVLPAQGITVKIAAIEQRSRFLIPDAVGGNIGIELGSDVATAINLDDYMVFDNDEKKAVAFFKSLVLKHVQVALGQRNKPAPKTEAELISQGFTQINAFEEVVRACEGVPRDAINILSHAAQRTVDETIAVADVRAAARQWYLASKDAEVNAHPQARTLLTWIVDKVIKERQTKAFLLEVGTRDGLIDFLYDERVLHVLRKGISAKDEPGKRYNVYGIDYGCYVDLINTAKAPQGLLDLGDQAAEYEESVPKTDLRSVRRCVLQLSTFYADSPSGV
ncbi:hypothetical protein WJ24_22015 [Burkholderia vietnamiensis]|uniref:hypothetical protein n=1 Tax=Burkholderia vietnamiensis TaxID=60552 RepID=UPI00075C81C2|nr:hypothetical protein [Burkholderia vietnamiensis]KVG07253.1 hypothetical protein WJ24_22015 [Burkholderia vietnamiensis]